MSSQVSPNTNVTWITPEFTATTSNLEMMRPVPNQPVQTFHDTWLEFRKMFGPVLLDNDPLITDFKLNYRYKEFRQPEIQVELAWIPKKTQRRMF